MTSQEINKLIQKYLNNQATLDEINLLNELDRFAQKKMEQHNCVANKEKEELKNEMFANIQRDITPHKIKLFDSWYKVAVIFIVFLGVTSALFIAINRNNGIKTITNNTKERIEHELPDGSIVIINLASTLSYDNDFNEETRTVKLSGEAYFKVFKNKQKPFLVNTGDVSTKVVGTQFNVKTSDSVIQVTVSEGLVKVYDNDGSVDLKENQQALYNVVNNSLSSKNVNAQLFDCWTKSKVVLDSISISELAVVLEQLYKVKISFYTDRVINQKLSISIDESDGLSQIIERVNLIGEVQLIQKSNNMIEIK